MKRFLIFFNTIFCFCLIHSQTIIQMVEDMGVYKIPCEINGLKVKMIFDTGASAVSLSSSLAEMMLDNGYISSSDFVRESKSFVADGRIVDHCEINLKSIKIGGITLDNVVAVVLRGQHSPLLFGQTAIQRLGKVSIKGDKLFIEGSDDTGAGPSSNTHFEKWDAQNYIYSNYTYGFGWDLPRDYKWTRVEGQEKHTVFRAESEIGFTVFVNIHVDNLNTDLWDVYDKFTTLVEQLDKSIEKRTGQIVYERTFEKCTLLREHAVKTTFKEYFKDSRYKEAKESYAEEYFLSHNGYRLIIAVKIPKYIYDVVDCSDEISKVFIGFRISVKH